MFKSSFLKQQYLPMYIKMYLTIILLGSQETLLTWSLGSLCSNDWYLDIASNKWLRMELDIK